MGSWPLRSPTPEKLRFRGAGTCNEEEGGICRELSQKKYNARGRTPHHIHTEHDGMPVKKSSGRRDPEPRPTARWANKRGRASRSRLPRGRPQEPRPTARCAGQSGTIRGARLRVGLPLAAVPRFPPPFWLDPARPRASPPAARGFAGGARSPRRIAVCRRAPTRPANGPAPCPAAVPGPGGLGPRRWWAAGMLKKRVS